MNEDYGFSDGDAYICYFASERAITYYYVPIKSDLSYGEQERDLTFWLGIEGKDIV